MAGGRRSIGREHAGGRWQTADRARVQPGHRLSHPLGGGTADAMQEWNQRQRRKATDPRGEPCRLLQEAVQEAGCCECPPQFRSRQPAALQAGLGARRARVGPRPLRSCRFLAGRLAPQQVPGGLTGAAPPGAQSSPGRCMTRGPMSAQKAHLAVSLGSRPSTPSGDGCCFWGPQNEGVIPGAQ